MCIRWCVLDDVFCWQCVDLCPAGGCVCWATVVRVVGSLYVCVGRWTKQKQLFIKQRQVYHATDR
jgi:hypothetical protein